MTQREPKEPSRLLEDLESIRTLLDEDQPTDAPVPPLDIPLLEDIISSSGDAPVPPPRQQPTPPGGKPANPFLPYDSLARLAGERVQLERLLQQSFEELSANPHTGAREVRMEARLQSEAQLLLQDVIDEILPVIEAELRKRLSSKLEQIVQEQMRQGGPGTQAHPRD